MAERFLNFEIFAIRVTPEKTFGTVLSDPSDDQSLIDRSLDVAAALYDTTRLFEVTPATRVTRSPEGTVRMPILVWQTEWDHSSTKSLPKDPALDLRYVDN